MSHRTCCGQDGRAPNWAFTLIELLVVIAIIAILAAMVMVGMSKAGERGRSTACLSNLHQIGVALQLYLQDNNNHLPVMRDRAAGTNQPPDAPPSPDFVLKDLVGNTNVFKCPSDKQLVYEQTGSSYSWNNLLNGESDNDLHAMGMNFNSTAIPVFYDKASFHALLGASRAVNYLYADGHIKNLLTVEGTLQASP